MTQNPSPNPTENEQTLSLAIDVLHATSVALAKLIGATTSDVPRLSVGAACRTVERLAASPIGMQGAYMAATDLKKALEEALDNLSGVMQTLEPEIITEGNEHG